VSIEFKTHEITENDGPVVWAHMATCSCAGAESFRVYWVHGLDHPHIECIDCDTAYCPFGLCQIPEKQVLVDPVHEHDGEWFFWDDTRFSRKGPFPDEYTARVEHRRYQHWRSTGEDFPR